MKLSQQRAERRLASIERRDQTVTGGSSELSSTNEKEGGKEDGEGEKNARSCVKRIAEAASRIIHCDTRARDAVTVAWRQLITDPASERHLGPFLVVSGFVTRVNEHKSTDTKRYKYSYHPRYNRY